MEGQKKNEVQCTRGGFRLHQEEQETKYPCPLFCVLCVVICVTCMICVTCVHVRDIYVMCRDLCNMCDLRSSIRSVCVCLCDLCDLCFHL